MSDERALRVLKRRLARTWVPFFSRFGRLLPSQIAALPPVLDGRNVFLSAATASGKTEAIVAPLAERLAESVPAGIALAYVAPTRALVNDIEKRIRPPLEELGISCRVRTGDRPELREDHPSSVVVTTPESLDSVLTRRPDLFASLRAVVLDELHLVDKNYRGDQLRLLLQRLKRTADSPIQVCGASATLDDPEAMACRYADDPIWVQVPGSRDIKERYVDSITALADTLKSEAAQTRKVLCFANSRRACEETAERLGRSLPNWPVMVHHGSIDRREREGVERELRDTPRWLCVATMTLEIGIDIGDVDAVALIEPPWTVAALLQRIGRANRRGGHINVLALARDTEARLMYQEQFRRAREGILDRREYRPDLSVVVQQMFALLSGSPGGLPDATVRDLFSSFCAADELEAVLSHLQGEDHVSRKRDLWYAATHIMDLAEKGKLYSNVPDSFTRTVVDASKGQQVGEVADAVDSSFVLSGRSWRVVSVTDTAIYVEPSASGAAPALFQIHRDKGAFTRYLPPALRTNAESGPR